MAESELVRAELAVLQLFLREMHQPSKFRGLKGMPPLWQETTSGPLILRSPKQELGRYLAAIGLLLQEDGPVDIGNEERRFAWQVLPKILARILEEGPDCSPAAITVMVVDTVRVLAAPNSNLAHNIAWHLKENHRSELKQCRDAVNALLQEIAGYPSGDADIRHIRTLFSTYGVSHHFPLNHFASAELMDFLASVKKNETWEEAKLAGAMTVFAEVARELSTCAERLDVAANNALANGVMRLARQSGAQALATLEALGLSFARRIPGSGAMSVKGFSAVLDGLVAIGTEEAASVLVHLSEKAQTPTMRESALKRLDKLAFNLGLTQEQLLDAAVPTFEMGSQGIHVFPDGICVLPTARGTALLALIPASGVDSHKSGETATLGEGARDHASAGLPWRLALPKFESGEPSERGRKSLQPKVVEASVSSTETSSCVPEALRAVPPKLKKSPGYLEAVSLQKEMQKALTLQRKRIEDWLLVRRTFVFEELRARVLDHPLIGPMSRTLIWNLDREPSMLINGAFCNAQGNPVVARSEMECTLWHPLDSGVSEIEVWRDLLFQLELMQPIKQAYREVYLLTDAERTTRTYSNRFAAHVLKQGQFGALARERNWRFQPAMYAHVQPMAKRAIPGTDLVAEFSFEGIYEWNDGMMMDFVTSDALRFTRNKQPVPLEDIPRDVFSEICRDCDLFVSVASAGNDPTWVDQNLRHERWRQQIETSIFGELAPSAESRKAVLERLLPRLAIGKVSHIEGRWLVVRGTRKTYKIHLGSGNILMSPNDQYLCIVPKSAAETSIYLPFEGDRMLSIILSKAELLMRDDTITDPTILSQL